METQKIKVKATYEPDNEIFYQFEFKAIGSSLFLKLLYDEKAFFKKLEAIDLDSNSIYFDLFASLPINQYLAIFNDFSGDISGVALRITKDALNKDFALSYVK